MKFGSDLARLTAAVVVASALLAGGPPGAGALSAPLSTRSSYPAIGHGGIPTPSDFYNMERATVRGYGGYAPVPWVG